jgi:hypothetical protein
VDLSERITRVEADKRFDDMHRHTTRWMTALMVVLGIMSVAVTVTNVLG